MNTTEEIMDAQHRPRIMLANKPLVKISLEISGTRWKTLIYRYYVRMLMKRGG